MQIQKCNSFGPDDLMSCNRCYFRCTFNIFLYIILTQKHNLIQIYSNQIQNITKSEKIIIRVIDIFIINYIIAIIIIINDILYLMLYITIAFVI